MNVDKKSLEIEFSIAICRPTGDKWQSKTLFLSIFCQRPSIVKSVFDCRLPGVKPPIPLEKSIDLLLLLLFLLSIYFFDAKGININLVFVVFSFFVYLFIHFAFCLFIL